MDKKVSRKEKAAQELLKLVGDQMKDLSVEEQERRWDSLRLKVAELKKKHAKSSKPRALSRGRRRTQTAI